MIRDSHEFRKCIENDRNNTILRQFFPRKYRSELEILNNDDSHKAFLIETSSWTNSYPDKNEMQVLCHNICSHEDFMLINGGVGDFKGLREISVDYDKSLRDAIREYGPYRIIVPANANDLGVGIPDRVKIKCNFIDEKCVYLIPIIMPDVGKFIITRDICEEFKPCDYNYNTTDDYYGRYIFSEWIDIEIYKPENFVKVRIE